MSIYRIEIEFNGQVSVMDITQSTLHHCMELAQTMHRITTEYARTNVQTSLIQDGYCMT